MNQSDMTSDWVACPTFKRKLKLKIKQKLAPKTNDLPYSSTCCNTSNTEFFIRKKRDVKYTEDVYKGSPKDHI